MTTRSETHAARVRLRVLHLPGSLCLVSALLLAACDEGSDPSATPQPGEVAGDVVDERGQGVGGVELTLSREGAASRTTSSAADGSFLFTEVEPGTWQLAAEPPEGLELDPAQPAVLEVVVIPGGRAPVLRRVRHRRGRLEGFAHDEIGRGVAGVTVALTREDFGQRSTVSEADGSFQLAGVQAGEWQLEATPPEGYDLAPDQDAQITVQIAGDAAAAVELRLRRPGVQSASGWTLLRESPVPAVGRHDDVFFLDADRGWLINLDGEVHRTLDGGATWTKVYQAEPATALRAVGFASPDVGWAGNLNFTHSEPQPGRALFETRDGGTTWSNITDRITGPEPVGICGIWVVDAQTIFAVGRWSSPAIFLRSRDGGASWQSFDMSPTVTGLIDVYFFDRDHGIIVGGRGVGPSIEEQQSSVTAIMGTDDGGDSWHVLYEGGDVGAWAWKISFPTPDVGYVATQGPGHHGIVLKTTDRGETWSRIVVAAGVSFSGIGFVTPDTGWVGGEGPTYQTTDGGATWTEVDFDPALNRFRVLAPDLAFASGSRVYRYDGS